MPAVKVAAVIDDFERADGRSNLDTLVVTNPDGGLDRSTEMIQILPRENGGHALLMTASMSVKEKPVASVIFPLTRGSIAPADLRGYHGVRLEIRGDGPYELRANGISGAWETTVEGASVWKTIEVPLSTLQKVGRAREGVAAAAWSGDDITEIELVVQRPAGVKTWLELDNVMLY